MNALTTEAMCTKRQVATLEQQKLTATGLGGSLGQCEGHGRDKASSTPPVVPVILKSEKIVFIFKVLKSINRVP